jgi:hypothetical protein
VAYKTMRRVIHVAVGVWLRRSLVPVVVLCGMLAVQALDAPSGKVILTLTGLIGEANQGKTKAEFDMAMLEKLPQHRLKTRTPWHEEVREYTGPRLRDVLAAVKSSGKSIRAIALNDYMVEIPMEDIEKYDVIVARLADGKPMTVREKGPLFIMYPFDSSETLQSPLYYGRAAWQLKAIEIR